MPKDRSGCGLQIPPPTPPFLRGLPRHEFDSSKHGELQGSSIANIVKARGKLRTATAAMPLPHGALVSVAVQGASRVEVETDPEIFILRFDTGGRFRCEFEGRTLCLEPIILLSPGTHFHARGENESSLLVALHRSAVDRSLGPQTPSSRGMKSVGSARGPQLRSLAFSAAIEAERLPERLREKLLRNFQNAFSLTLGAVLGDFQCESRRSDPLIGRRNLVELREWAALDHPEPLTVGNLAARCGLGLRALQKNFQRHFGTTPLLFLRELRLQKVRRLLLDDSANRTVTEAALDAGFAHLGRFPSLYRERFGELPNATLARTRIGRRG